jgi:hypothetical protein
MANEHTTDVWRLRFGTVGWRRPQWDDGYYPDDLPSDWQLGYYANELAAVLLEPGDWLSAEPTQLADWAGEVHADFRFYLRADTQRDAAGQLRLAQSLGSRLGAVLWPVAPAPAGALAPVELATQRVTAWGDAAGVKAALLDVAGLDLRARRGLLEQLAPLLRGGDAGAIFLEDPVVTPGAARELQMVAELMGLA